ncbi:MAG TPA: cyclic nucleotide-binding domain-containing protein [Polyangia bacterium]|nr:cyclic nucleotide-binding domain-containing protein [Polyangia bacterium]
MTTTVGELKGEARVLVRAGELGAALAAYDHVLAHNPLDYGCRMNIADLLAGLGDAGGAGAVYRALALHNLRAGHPAPAIVCCKELERLGQMTDDIVAELASTYAQGAPALARFAARQAPVEESARLPRPDLTGTEPVTAIAPRARARALDFSVYTGYPQHHLPLAFLSELPAPVFAPVIRALKVQRLSDGDLVIREGEPGVAFYLVAAGQVRVFATDSLGRQTERARLHEAALFGEMSLLTAQPRTASVQVVGEADIVEVGRDALNALAAEIPAMGAALDRFARERLLKNLLATSPLFRPFNRQQQMDLVRRFDGHEVDAGTEIIREGGPGLGLFVVLAGEVEVTKRQPPAAGPAGAGAGVTAAAEVSLARLRAGEVFGEMSLINNQPTSASVRAARRSTILFLARDYFQRLVEALPEIRRYFEELSARRGMESQLVLGSTDQTAPEDDGDQRDERILI